MSSIPHQALIFQEDLAAKVAELKAAGAHICELPREIGSVRELHDALADGLAFPEYYGRNWDALEEMLSDLEWLQRRHVAIVHWEVPRLDEAQLALYLRVVLSASSQQRASRRRLLCLLPAQAQWLQRLINGEEQGPAGVN